MRPAPPALALAAAILAYGLIGVPAPAGVGLREIVIGTLLALAVLMARPWSIPAIGWSPDAPTWARSGVMALGWLLCVPLLTGLIAGWSADDILRDVVPLLFLFAPLAFVPSIREAGSRRLIRTALLAAGFAFTVRWWQHAGWRIDAVGVIALDDGTAYLLNAPSVLFAAIGLPASGFGLMVRGGWQRILGGLCLGLAGALCLVALAGAVHRLAFALALVALAVAALRETRGAPAGRLWLFSGGLVLAGAFGIQSWKAVALAIEKSRQVGLNARLDETIAVFDQCTRTFGTLLLGDGWGALIANPAVGGWRVSYTHSLPTYAAVKTGLFGLLALSWWLGSLAGPVRRALRASPSVALAALAPLAIALTLHGSYKYLDTGLLLALVLAQGEDAPAQRKTLLPSPTCV